MFVILEPIIKGLFQWLYGLILDLVAYCANGLLGVMNADLGFFETHVPIINTIVDVFIGVGWALLIGNCVFQAMKSMLSGFGFDGEDPHILLIRTGIFGFLLIASRQVCEIGLGISGAVIRLLEIPTNITITNLGEDAFSGVGSAGWLLVIIFGLIMMFQIFKLLFEIGERYVVVAVLTFFSPLAFAMGGSKSTHDIFKGWVRMYASMMLMMVLNIVFLKMILSAMSTVPTGTLLLPWLVLIVSLAKVGRKIDSHIARIGLNPAVTGDKLGGGFPGFVAYTVARNMISNVAHRGAGVAGGVAATGGNSGASGRPSGVTGGPSGGTNGSGPISNSPVNNTSSNNNSSAAGNNNISTSQSQAMSQNTVRPNNAGNNPAAPGAANPGGGPLYNPAKDVQGQNTVNPSNKRDAGGLNTSSETVRHTDNGHKTTNSALKGQNGQTGSNTIVPSSEGHMVQNKTQNSHNGMKVNSNTVRPNSKDNPMVIPTDKMAPRTDSTINQRGGNAPAPVNPAKENGSTVRNNLHTRNQTGGGNTVIPSEQMKPGQSNIKNDISQGGQQNRNSANVRNNMNGNNLQTNSMQKPGANNNQGIVNPTGGNAGSVQNMQKSNTHMNGEKRVNNMTNALHTTQNPKPGGTIINPAGSNNGNNPQNAKPANTPVKHNNAGGVTVKPNNSPPANVNPNNNMTGQSKPVITNQSRYNHAANSIRQDSPPLINNRAVPPGSQGNGPHTVNTNTQGGTPASGNQNQRMNNQNMKNGQQRPGGNNQKNSGTAVKGQPQQTTNKGIKGTPPVKSANNNRNIKPVDPKKNKPGGERK